MTEKTRAARAVRAVVSAAVALLVLAGCVRIDGELTINGTESEAPDTVSGTVLVAVLDEWAIEHGQDPADLSDAIVEELAASADSGVTGEPYAEDGYTGVTLTLNEVPIDRISASTDGALSVTRDGDTYVLRGDLSVLNPGEDERGEPTPWTARLAVTMPETVTEHNGELDGETVTWQLDDTTPEPTMVAVSAVGPVSWWSKVPIPLVLLTVIAGIGALLAWRWSRRERARRDDDDGGVRARQARAREGTSTKLDDMFANAKHEDRGRKVSPSNKPGPKPRKGR